MGKFQYEYTNGKYRVKNCDEEFLILEIDGFEIELTKRYRELLSQKHDLERAQACLDQMFFNKDTTLIDGALINSAIQLLVRCFTKSGKEDRLKFDEVYVFEKYSISIGEENLYKQYMQFYVARNKVLSHDELNYHNNIVGITIDLHGTAQDITPITVSTTYVYKQNKDLLKRLINIAHRYAEEQISTVEKLLIDRYNACDPKPILSPIDSTRLGTFDSWNSW